MKLRTHGQPAANTNSRPVQQVIASPLQSRDTDTGNLSVMSDTQTRRTVKLKPLTPGGHRPVQVPAPAPAAAPVSVPPPASANKADDDITRKVTMVKPAAKPGISSLSGAAAPVAPGVPSAPAAPTVVMAPEAQAEKKSDDDITRKVTMVKPAAKPGITLPEDGKVASPSKQTMVLPGNNAPAASAVSPSKQTMVLPAEDENSATVKIARPPSRTGMIPPKPALTPKPGVAPVSPSAPTVPAVPKAEAAAAPAAAPAEKKVPSLAKVPAVSKPADAAPAEKAPEAQEEAPKKLGLKKSADKAESSAGGPPILDDVVVKANAGGDASPSIFYTVITAVAVILLLASAAISAVNYLNFYEGQNIQLPGLSSTK